MQGFSGASIPEDATVIQLFEKILNARRSVYAYRDDEVPIAYLRWALDAAVAGPNHHKTRPWRFHVFTKGGREKLANAYEAAAIRLSRDPSKARARAFEAPVMIAVSCVPEAGNPKVKQQEEEFATAVAIENLMLALAALNIGSLWTSGDFVTGFELASTLSINTAYSKVLGVVHVGYADAKRPLPPRDFVPHDQFTTWIDA